MLLFFSCSSCLNSNWKCSWCMKDNQCTSNENQCTKRNGLSYGSAHIQSIDSCTKIHNSEEIKLSNGVPSEIYLQLVNLPIEASHSTVSNLNLPFLFLSTKKTFFVCLIIYKVLRLTKSSSSRTLANFR